jgi:nucleoside-diphosphate-sugar epimerase
MKVLITGASGFIGSFLVECAIEKGYEAWAGVRSSSSREYLKDKRIHFIDLDFGNKENLKRQIGNFSAAHGKFDYIVHNAGITKTVDIRNFDAVNFVNTRNFAEALIETENVPKKFILMSSLSACGAGDETGYAPLKLSDPPAPDTEYGKSKLKAEQMLTSLTGFPCMILRPTGVYGPREKDYLLMLKTVKAGLDIGAGFRPQRLTFIYVRDLAEAVFLALESPLVNKCYFVADGDVYTGKEYTRLIKKALGKRFVLNIKIPLGALKAVSVLSEEWSKRSGKPSTLNRDKYKIMRQRNWTCDTAPLVNDLGFKPKYRLYEGLQESVAWYRQNGWL